MNIENGLARRNWVILAFLVVMVLAASSPAAVILKLLEGTTVTGDVVEKTDSNVVIKTSTGIRTLSWREVTIDTLKVLHPELYARLKAQADERARNKPIVVKQEDQTMLAAGKVKLDGKWMTKEEALMRNLRRMRINLAAREQDKVVDKHKDFATSYSKEKDTTVQCWGEVAVKLDGLEPANAHAFKITIIQYRASLGGGYYDSGSSSYSSGSRSSSGSTSSSGSGTSAASSRKNTVEQEFVITGAPYTNMVFKTEEYERTKMVYSSSYSGSSKSESGMKSDGFDVAITIDGVLVYDQKKGAAPKYYHVGGR